MSIRTVDHAPASESAAAATGVDDHVYDLVLVLQQALEDTIRYRNAASDADEQGDDELAKFFLKLCEADRRIVDEAQRLLKERLPA
jgi:hypothetical protein